MSEMKEIAKHLDRIASCLERQEQFAQEALNTSVEESMEKALSALKNSNPIFARAFEMTEKMLEGKAPNAVGSGRD